MKKKKSIKKYYNVNDVIADLQDSFKFLSHSFKIPGKNYKDIKQDLAKYVLELYKNNPKYYKRRKKGWWFIRCRWHLMNTRRDIFRRDPMARSISINNLGSNN